MCFKFIIDLNSLWVLYKCYRHRLLYNIISAAIFLAIIFAYTVWGYILYFSDDNDCQQIDGATFWLVIMITLLVLGLFTCFFALCLIPVIIYIYCRQ